MSQNKWRIAVLYGGNSSEREVSVHSGEAVVAALDQKGHVVRPIDVRGRSIEALDDFECDVVFNALHGPFGEDGQLQLLLELRGIPYTGSGVEASRLAMDKAASKECFLANGLPTPAWFSLDETSRSEERRAAVVSMGFPQIVKPAREGSSIGVTVARSVSDALHGLQEGFKLDTRVLIERFIRGRELTVSILGRRTLPIIELQYPGLIFDYHAKYTRGVTRHVINPKMSEAAASRVREVAFAAHQALGCRDISRVDLMLSEDLTPYVLEVNTSPGMTETSLVPDAAKAAGIPFPDLCEALVRHAINAHSRVNDELKEEGN